MTSYPPIGSYAFLSDTHTAALVGLDGAVDWMCVPAFDGPSIFGRILDREIGGEFVVDIGANHLVRRRYLDDTLVLESRYSGSGTVVVHDFLAVGEQDDQTLSEAPGMLVRLVRVLSGHARVRVSIRPRPDYGAAATQWIREHDDVWSAPQARVWLSSGLPLQNDGECLSGAFDASGGDRLALVLGYGDAAPRQVSADDAEGLMRQTRLAWEHWTARSRYDGFAKEQVLRSALVLRGLAFDKSGALLAAPTTSLPEEVGGERNWDYRYTWHRDAALLLLALFRLNHSQEGERYLRFLVACGTDEDGWLRPMAPIGGAGEVPDETALEHLHGYLGSNPVRVGNDAYRQRQLDTYGHILDAALAYQELTGALTAEQWSVLRAHVETASRAWHQPDHGIWEIRGPLRHYVNSKIMAWVCLDRGIRLAELLADEDAPTTRWGQARDEIRDEVLRRGYDTTQECFVQAYDSTELDASLLRIPLVGFLPGDDPRVVRTVDRIRERLAGNGALVRRYDGDDGLSGREGAFLLCSFEMVSALAVTGRRDEAVDAFRWLCKQASPLGLFAEQMDVNGTALGNYPQAFTHLALIEAAVNIDSIGTQDALHVWAERRAGQPRA